MGFTKKGNIYKITRMTGNEDHFLGISFSENIDQDPKIPEIIEVQIPNPKKSKMNLQKIKF